MLLEEVRAQFAAVLESVTPLHRSVDEIRETLANHGSRFDKLEGQMSGVISTLREHSADLKELKFDVKVLKSDVKVLKSDVTVLKSDVKELKSDVTELKAGVKELKSDNKELKSDLKEVKQIVGGQMESIAELRIARHTH